MKSEKQIMLSKDSVGEFVKAAKSILGVLSLDLNKVLTVRYSGTNDGFEKVLKKYCVA